MWGEFTIITLHAIRWIDTPFAYYCWKCMTKFIVDILTYLSGIRARPHIGIASCKDSIQIRFSRMNDSRYHVVDQATLIKWQNPMLNLYMLLWMFLLPQYEIDVLRIYRFSSTVDWSSLQWRHNGCNGVSNHKPRDCYSSVYSGTDQRKHDSSASLTLKCFHLMTLSWLIKVHQSSLLLILSGGKFTGDR